MTALEALFIAGLIPLAVFTIRAGCLGSITHSPKRQSHEQDARQLGQAAHHAKGVR